jgi:hypothetical protein
MSKVEVNIQPIIEKIKRNFSEFGLIRTLKGIGKNEGHVLIIVTLDANSDLKININVAEMLTNKQYFDGMMDQIQELRMKALQRRQELCRVY